jgi:hypothetical protein
MKRLSVPIGLGIFSPGSAEVGPSAPAADVTQPSLARSAQRKLPPSSSSSPESPPADERISYAASELSRALADDDRLASVEVLRGKEIVVHWDGPVDSMLQDLLDRFPGLGISVEPTSCSPGKLREYGRRLLTSDPAVKGISVSPDGSTLRLTLDESVKATSDAGDLERKYTEAGGCTVRVEFGTVIPAKT